MCKKMCKNITLNDVIDSAFLADQAYKNAKPTSDKYYKEDEHLPKDGIITNPATKASFEVINTNEYAIAYRGAELKDPNDFRTNARMGF
ncbi:MAG: hypothetical protein SPF98_05495 [Campylobacter sp.]|nr:hypothetical protein [Campylobacter sp.]